MDKQMKQQVQIILAKYQLCNACLGRLFTQYIKGIGNEKRGKKIRENLHLSTQVSSDSCWLCEGLLNEIEHFAQLIQKVVDPYEFDTFLIGSIIEQDILDKEQQLWKLVDNTGVEPMKMEINREVGKILEKELGKNVDFEDPHVTVLLDTAFDDIKLQVKSLYLYGRYLKFKRGIPQTRWLCKICRGKGCKACHYSGRLYEESVEELIANKVLQETGGTAVILHGSGREDIDALTLGNGRPFVLEIKNPKKRSIHLTVLQKRINQFAKQKIVVNNLRLSNKEEIARIKQADFRKIYRVIIQGEQRFGKEKLKEVAQVLRGQSIRQFTPTRVAHRRANKIREKKIYNCTIESVKDTIARVIIETQSGTYIKELVSGDKGRTVPNISDMIGIPCSVKELDVIEIKGE
jgi:tRNA pseudouridine synthase 10